MRGCFRESTLSCGQYKHNVSSTLNGLSILSADSRTRLARSSTVTMADQFPGIGRVRRRPFSLALAPLDDGGEIKLLFGVVAERLQVDVGVFDKQPAADAARDPVDAEFERGNAGGAGEAWHRRVRVAENIRQKGRGSRGLLGELKTWGKIRVGAEQRMLFVVRRPIAIGPARDLVVESCQFGPDSKIDRKSGAGDQEIERSCSMCMGQPNPSVRETDSLKRTAEPHGEVFVKRASVEGFLRRRLVHVENDLHETPFSRVVQVSKMTKEAGKLHPSVRIGGWKLLPADQQFNRSRAIFERHRGIVEGGCTGTDYGDRLSCKRPEIDLFGGVGISISRQRFRNHPWD